MSAFRAGDCVRVTDKFEGLDRSYVGKEGVLEAAEIDSAFPWLLSGVDNLAVYEHEIELIEPTTPTPGAIVDVTRRTVTKTVEEEVVEYPELPALTVVEDADGAVWLHAGSGCLWFRASADDQPYPDSALSWPVKVLRYGKGNA